MAPGNVQTDALKLIFVDVWCGKVEVGRGEGATKQAGDHRW